MKIISDNRFGVLRQTACDVEKENALVRATYDLINLHTVLLDNISFRDLFTQSWGELAPRIATNAKKGRDRGVLCDTERAEALLEALGTQFPSHTLACFGTDQEDRAAFDAANAILSDLWREGLYLAYPHGFPRMEHALSALLHYAPDFTYCRIYTQSKRSVSQPMVAAIHAAISSGILLTTYNNQCCFATTIGGETTYDCRARTGNFFCLCATDDQDTCPSTGDGDCDTYGCCVGSLPCT